MAITNMWSMRALRCSRQVRQIHAVSRFNGRRLPFIVGIVISLKRASSNVD